MDNIRKGNRQYHEMLQSAVDKLKGRTPEEIERHTALNYVEEKRCFETESFGRDIQILYPSYEISPELGMWSHLTILQYMYEADGTPLSTRWISLREFKTGGFVRGSSFEQEYNKLIPGIIKDASIDKIKKAAKMLGGTPCMGNGDISMQFYFMPMFPLCLKIWLEDDEFPASCKILFNGSAEHYLKVEASGVVGNILLDKLGEALAVTPS